MNDSDFEIDFREWFENNVAKDDAALVEAMYRPLYIAFLAGAASAVKQYRKVEARHAS